MQRGLENVGAPGINGQQIMPILHAINEEIIRMDITTTTNQHALVVSMAFSRSPIGTRKKVKQKFLKAGVVRFHYGQMI